MYAAALRALRPAPALVLALLALALPAASHAAGSVAAAGFTGASSSTAASTAADPNGLTSPPTMDQPPPGHRLSGDEVQRIAGRQTRIKDLLKEHKGAYPNVYLKGADRWQVSYFTKGKKPNEIGQVLILDATALNVAPLNHVPGAVVSALGSGAGSDRSAGAAGVAPAGAGLASRRTGAGCVGAAGTWAVDGKGVAAAGGSAVSRRQPSSTTSRPSRAATTQIATPPDQEGASVASSTMGAGLACRPGTLDWPRARSASAFFKASRM